MADVMKCNLSEKPFRAMHLYRSGYGYCSWRWSIIGFYASAAEAVEAIAAKFPSRVTEACVDKAWGVIADPAMPDGWRWAEESGWKSVAKRYRNEKVKEVS